MTAGAAQFMRVWSVAPLVFVCVMAGHVAPAVAQEAADWTPCSESESVPSLGGRDLNWDHVSEPGPDPVPLGARPTTRPGAPQESDASADTFELVFCLEPAPDVFPDAQASRALVFLVAAASGPAYMSIEIYRGSRQILESDSPAPQQSALISSEPFWPRPSDPDIVDNRVFVVVTREDAVQQPSTIVAWIEEEPLAHDAKFENGRGWFVESLSEGNAFRYTADAASYQSLLDFARCDWVSDEARRGTARDPGCLATQMAALDEVIYPFVSTLTGRSHEREVQEGQPRASLSEPMIVFFGLGGSNRILLLDCRVADGNDTSRRCTRYAEPWQTTLQRARYMWAVYIEDAQTPFNTSIDVEFKPTAPSVDYEEYDPSALARPQAAASAVMGTNRVLRVGYRRFRIREPPVAVEVAFSRQGPNYGLRQWVRVYRQFSSRWWVISGAIFVPATKNTVSHVELEPILPPAGGPPDRARIFTDEPPAPVYAAVVWRWPQVRGRAENQAGASTRLLVNLIPDVIGGLSLPPRRHNSYLVGGSWPILADRVSFVMGAKIFRDEHPADGYFDGQYVPATTSIDEVRAKPRHHVDFLFGLAFEIVRSR